jgi:hypothetical protein
MKGFYNKNIEKFATTSFITPTTTTVFDKPTITTIFETPTTTTIIPTEIPTTTTEIPTTTTIIPTETTTTRPINMVMFDGQIEVINDDNYQLQDNLIMNNNEITLTKSITLTTNKPFIKILQNNVTFNGNGYTINIVNNYSGLFQIKNKKNININNFHIRGGSIKNGGAIIRNINYPSVFSRKQNIITLNGCSYKGKLFDNAGGICGNLYISIVNINNCYVNCESNKYGSGVITPKCAYTDLNINNCYSYLDLTNTGSVSLTSSFIGSINSSNINVNNCYYDADYDTRDEFKHVNNIFLFFYSPTSNKKSNTSININNFMYKKKNDGNTLYNFSRNNDAGENFIANNVINYIEYTYELSLNTINKNTKDIWVTCEDNHWYLTNEKEPDVTCSILIPPTTTTTTTTQPTTTPIIPTTTTEIPTTTTIIPSEISTTTEIPTTTQPITQQPKKYNKFNKGRVISNSRRNIRSITNFGYQVSQLNKISVETPNNKNIRNIIKENNRSNMKKQLSTNQELESNIFTDNSNNQVLIGINKKTDKNINIAKLEEKIINMYEERGFIVVVNKTLDENGKINLYVELEKQPTTTTIEQFTSTSTTDSSIENDVEIIITGDIPSEDIISDLLDVATDTSPIENEKRISNGKIAVIVIVILLFLLLLYKLSSKNN